MRSPTLRFAPSEIHKLTYLHRALMLRHCWTLSGPVVRTLSRRNDWFNGAAEAEAGTSHLTLSVASQWVLRVPLRWLRLHREI